MPWVDQTQRVSHRIVSIPLLPRKYDSNICNADEFLGSFMPTDTWFKVLPIFQRYVMAPLLDEKILMTFTNDELIVYIWHKCLTL